MLKLAWRDVRLHPVRFSMSVLAVFLGVAFVAGTFAMRTMLGNTFDQIVTTSVDGDVYIHADTGQVPDLALGEAAAGEVPFDLVNLATDLSSVVYARANYSGPIVLVGQDGQPVQSGGGGGAPSQAMAVNAERSAWSGYTIEGREPVGQDEIVLEGATAERAGLVVGSQTLVVVGHEPRSVTVTGIFHSLESTAFAGAVLVGISEDWAQLAYAPAGTVGSITVFAAAGHSPQQVLDEVLSVLPVGASASLASDVQAASMASINQLLGFINAFLMIFAVIALFVGSFIIANTFAMVVRQRRRETAVIRAVGASPTQVFASFVGQAAIVGLVGSALGLAGGYGLVQLIRQVFGAIGMPLAANFPWSVAGVVVPTALGVVTSCLAAGLPARQAARVAPVDAMRDGVEADEVSLRLRTQLASGLTALGLALVIVGLSRRQAGGVWLGLGAVAVLAGVLGLAPALAPAFIRVLAWPAVKLLPPFGAMARRSVNRNPRRTANTAAALLIGTALVGATTVLVTSTKASVQDLISSEVRADFIVQDLTYAPMSHELAAEITALDSMTAFTFGGLPARVPQIDQDVIASVADTEALLVASDAVVVEGSSTDLEGQVVLMNTFAEQFGYQVGDPFEIVLAPNTPYQVVVSSSVGAVIKSAVINMGPMLTWDMLRQALPPEPIEQMVTVFQMAILLDPLTDPTQAREALEAATGPYLTIAVLDRDQFASQVTNQINQVLYIIYALLALSIIIAVLGIVNTLALSVIERTREIGLMRAVGLGRRQLALTTVIEGVLIALFGAVLGLVLGTGLAATLPVVFSDIGLTTLVINWGWLAALLALAGLVGVLAAIWPAVRAARLPVLTAVSYD